MGKRKTSSAKKSTASSTSSAEQPSVLHLDLKGGQSLKTLVELALQAVAPPPDLTVSQWADTYRRLPAEGASEPGQWDTGRAEFQREPMDVITDPDVQDIVICGAIQLLKSEVELNAFGYFMHLDPCPIIMVQPDEKNADDFSKDRVASMIEATSELQERVFKRQGGRSTKKSTKHNIGFKGGYLAIASANVEASLSSKPARVILFDEVDKYPAYTNKGKDPIDLGKGRTSNFWNRKRIYVSSPGRKESSRVIPLYERSDKREYYVPCPHCGTLQTLKWGGKDLPYGIKWANNDHTTAHYVCEGCGKWLSEADKDGMVKAGQWLAHAPFAGIAGFRISSLYSPWFSWQELVREYLESKDDPSKLQVFVNTRLAEGWEDRGESVSDDMLMARREKYPAPVPMRAFVLTCFVDVQGDRLEALVQAWGKREECWNVEHAVFYGNPDEQEVWEHLESYRYRQFEHESGIKLPLTAMGIDSGYKSQKVYEFVRRMDARVFATKGVDGWGQPIMKSPSRAQGGKERRKVSVHLIGVDEAKDTVMQRLKKKPPGPYSYHFPDTDWCDDEFFKQLTAEKIVYERNKKGYWSRVWKNKRDRNEIFDMAVGCFALTKRLPPDWEAWEERIIPKHLVEQKPGHQVPTPTSGPAPSAPPERRVRSKGLKR
jgi:phage terminase large subunit GpA-like protein